MVVVPLNPQEALGPWHAFEPEPVLYARFERERRLAIPDIDLVGCHLVVNIARPGRPGTGSTWKFKV